MKTGVMRPQAKEVLDVQGEVWGRLFPKPAEVAWLCHHFDFRLPVSKKTMYLCFVLSHSLQHSVVAALGNKYVCRKPVLLLFSR